MKQRIRITKEFTFEAAHALDGYDGKCKDIHGHSYHLCVTVLGIPETDKSIPTCGMLIDFSDLKKIVNKNIINHFDHHLILRDDSRFKGIEKDNKRVRFVPYQPTCENMLLSFVHTLKSVFQDNLQLVSVKLRETGTSYAEWLLEDNI